MLDARVALRYLVHDESNGGKKNTAVVESKKGPSLGSSDGSVEWEVFGRAMARLLPRLKDDFASKTSYLSSTAQPGKLTSEWRVDCVRV